MPKVKASKPTPASKPVPTDKVSKKTKSKPAESGIATAAANLVDSVGKGLDVAGQLLVDAESTGSKSKAPTPVGLGDALEASGVPVKKGKKEGKKAVEQVQEQAAGAVKKGKKQLSEKLDESAKVVVGKVDKAKKAVKETESAVVPSRKRKTAEEFMASAQDTVVAAVTDIADRVGTVVGGVVESFGTASGLVADVESAVEPAKKKAKQAADKGKKAVKEAETDVEKKAKKGAKAVEETVETVEKKGKKGAKAAEATVEEAADVVQKKAKKGAKAVEETVETVEKKGKKGAKAAEAKVDETSKAVEKKGKQAKEAVVEIAQGAEKKGKKATKEVEETVEKKGKKAVKGAEEVVEKGKKTATETKAAGKKGQSIVADAVDVVSSAAQAAEPTITKGKRAAAAVADEAVKKGKKAGKVAQAAVAAAVEAANDVDMEDAAGFSSSDGGADSSDDESDDEDAAVAAAGKKIDMKSLPMVAKDDKSVQARLKKAAKKRDTQKGTLYLGRIPHGFYEDEMKEYFSQFGDVSRLRLARNRKTGASKHYAYIEMSSQSVAEIVADTMNNYLLMGHLLKCHVIPSDEVHPELWVGANKKFRVIPKARLEKAKHDKARTQEQQDSANAKLLKKQEDRREKIKGRGIEYDFDGHA